MRFNEDQFSVDSNDDKEGWSEKTCHQAENPLCVEILRIHKVWGDPWGRPKPSNYVGRVRV